MEREITTKDHGRRGTGRKLITLFLLGLFLILGIFIWWNYYYTYSDGTRYGLLQKFSRRGNLFKTYEGEMILSSVRGNADAPVASEKFFFTVTDDRVAQRLQDLQGKGITVFYKEKKSAAFWRGDSPYVVDSVRGE